MAYAHPPLDVPRLRWRLAPDTFAFETTADVEPIEGVVGQETAVEALSFGLEIDAPGQNVFVRGLTGTGRSTLIRRLLETIRPDCPRAPDRCYVHNFEKPDRPMLLTLPRGLGGDFRDAMDEFIRFVRINLAPALGSDVIKQRGRDIERTTAKRIETLTAPFDAELAEAGLTLVMAQMGPMTRQLILPVIDGEPAPPERVEALKQEGKLTDEQITALREKAEHYSDRLNALGQEVQKIQLETQERLKALIQAEARAILSGLLDPQRKRYSAEQVQAFLASVIEDVVERGLPLLGEPEAFTERYRVNLIEGHEPDEACPIVEEMAPSVQSLLGTIDRSVADDQATVAPHMLIHGGSLLRADGGYLIIDARDVLSEQGAWRALIRTLRSGHIEMVAPDGPVTWRVPPIKPQPIPVNVKVILLGGSGLYYLLDAMDADFPDLFKVLADFDDVIARSEQAYSYYAGVLARIVREERLLPFDRSAVAALCEHGARIAGRADKLTTRFGRLADLAREANYLAQKRSAEAVAADDVTAAVGRTKQRANLPSRRFQEAVSRGTIKIHTEDSAIGQINGLAVVQAGPLTYGFPSRITASVGPGRRGTINVEGEADMSGRIHTKGFAILRGLLHNLLRTDHPLAFDASVAFEQSYGGIDGDSASGAETVCLLSALARIPIRQDLAMTGAIDQHGNIQPIGAATEKIEGFFDVCQGAGFTGTQGVIIPEANVGDLMLRPDVVEACAAGRFAVYAVSRIEQAIGLFTGLEPGIPDADGHYAPDTVLGQVVTHVERLWEQGRPHQNGGVE
ncbi:MAG: ATP-binding protein [Planctomycetota bacterium]|nr:ATP-binding protein [Planctomycetota bacterium]